MKKEQYYIYLFRHGQTAFNEKHIFTGWKESNLTSVGKQQAKLLAKKLKKKKFGIAIQTKLVRSRDTLKEVLKFHPECRRILTDNRMIERRYGTLEGMHHDTIIKKYGQERFDEWHRGFTTRPPLGESFADVEKRVKKFIKDLKKRIKQYKTNVAISAHGNSIRLFRKIMEHKSLREVVQWTIPYDKVFIYSVVL